MTLPFRRALADLPLEGDRLHGALEELGHPRERVRSDRARAAPASARCRSRRAPRSRTRARRQRGRRSSTSAPATSASRRKSASARSMSSSLGRRRPRPRAARPRAVGNERPSVQRRRGSAPGPRRRCSCGRRRSLRTTSTTPARVPISRAPVLVLEEEPELAPVGDALADQLLVARLEDVQRDALGREQHDARAGTGRSPACTKPKRAGDGRESQSRRPESARGDRRQLLPPGARRARRRTSPGSPSRRSSGSSGSSASSSWRRTRARSGRSRPRSRRSSGAPPSSTATRTAAPTACAPRSPSGTASASRRSRSARARTALVDYLSQASLEPGDEIVCGWPSFASYPIYAREDGRGTARTCRCATTATTSTRCSTRSAPRTKLVYLCLPNNPTGTTNTRDELDACFDRVPRARADGPRPGVLRVRRRPGLPGRDRGVRRRQGRRVVVLRTFSKIYGLAGLRVGYGVGPADVVDRDRRRSRRAFDLTTPAQEAALASLGDAERARAPARARTPTRSAELERILARARPRAGRRARSANFVYVDVGEDARPLFERLLREGVIVRPLARLRRAGRDPRHGRHGRGARVPRRARRLSARRVGRVAADTAERPLVACRSRFRSPSVGLLARARTLGVPRCLFLATLGSGARHLARGRSR